MSVELCLMGKIRRLYKYIPTVARMISVCDQIGYTFEKNLDDFNEYTGMAIPQHDVDAIKDFVSDSKQMGHRVQDWLFDFSYRVDADDSGTNKWLRLHKERTGLVREYRKFMETKGYYV